MFSAFVGAIDSIDLFESERFNNALKGIREERKNRMEKSIRTQDDAKQVSKQEYVCPFCLRNMEKAPDAYVIRREQSEHQNKPYNRGLNALP